MFVVHARCTCGVQTNRPHFDPFTTCRSTLEQPQYLIIRTTTTTLVMAKPLDSAEDAMNDLEDWVARGKNAPASATGMYCGVAC
jgi:hypothetical protein